MDYLQYEWDAKNVKYIKLGFKPYYKWITFNTNISINPPLGSLGFKPYYKWITFNT